MRARWMTSAVLLAACQAPRAQPPRPPAQAPAPPASATVTVTQASIVGQHRERIDAATVVVEHVAFDDRGSTHSVSANGCGLAVATVVIGALVVSSARVDDVLLREGDWASSTNGTLTLSTPNGEHAEAVTLTSAAGCMPTVGERGVHAPARAAQTIPRAVPSILVWPDFNAGGSIFGGRLTGTGSVASHAHGASWEILVVVDGDGSVELDAKTQPLARGKIVAIAPQIRHAWHFGARSPMRAILFYAPGGPELRFEPPGAR